MLRRSPWPVILQIVPELSTGGAERTTIEMAEAITLGGGKALVVSSGGLLEDELAAVGGELIRFPAKTKNPAAVLFNAARLSRIIRQRGVSLVHARSRAPAWSAYLAARRTKRCFVTTYHGIYNQKGRVKAFYNGVMARGDAVICNSEYTAKIVRDRHPQHAERVGVIYRGVDHARFDVSAVSQERVRALRERWGIPSNKRIVLTPGRLTRWKGQTTLIHAAAMLYASGDGGDIVFALVGDDQGRTPYREELETLIASKGLQGKVVIAGHCEDMPAAYKASVLTVVPSTEAEAFGRVSIEAQAMGCPVIASNVGALPETIVAEPGLLARVESAGRAPHPDQPQGRQPWLVEPGNARALSNAIRTALAMEDCALEAYRQRMMERTKAMFSKSALQLQTLSVYDRLIGTQLAETFMRSR